MYEQLSVSTCVTIRSGCPVEYHLYDDQIEFRCGSRSDGFDFVFEAEALRSFVDRSTAALAELEIKRLSQDLDDSR